MKLAAAHFDELAVAELDVLYRVARRLTGNAASAEDLVQETYTRAFGARRDFDLKEFGIRPWLLRIMHNLHATRAGRDSRQPRGIDDEALQRLGQAAPVLEPNFTFDGLDQQIVHAFHKLPGEYQTVLLLWAIDDMSYKEIAHAVDVPIGTVMSRLHRARRQLYDLLHEYAVREGVIRE